MNSSSAAREIGASSRRLPFDVRIFVGIIALQLVVLSRLGKNLHLNQNDAGAVLLPGEAAGERPAEIHSVVAPIARRAPTRERANPSGASTLADAYAACCGRSGKPPEAHCAPEDDGWFSRLIGKRSLASSGRATLYWAHMRKAGGSSFGNAIESVRLNRTGEPGAAFVRGFVRTVKVHLKGGSRDCVEHRYANETLFVTVLRHPVSRYVSEYFYMELGRGFQSDKTEERLREWLGRSGMVPGLGRIMSDARKNFIENWQTRYYTNPKRCEDLDRPPPHDSHPNYSYWHSGSPHDPREWMGGPDLDAAKAVLDRFDVVGVAPFFKGDGGCDMVPWLVLAGSNRPAEATNVVANFGKKKKPKDVEYLAGNITKHLHEELKYDLELFEYARDLSIRRSAIACCVDQRMGGRVPTR